MVLVYHIYLWVKNCSVLSSGPIGFSQRLVEWQWNTMPPLSSTTLEKWSNPHNFLQKLIFIFSNLFVEPTCLFDVFSFSPIHSVILSHIFIPNWQVGISVTQGMVHKQNFYSRPSHLPFLWPNMFFKKHIHDR